MDKNESIHVRTALLVAVALASAAVGGLAHAGAPQPVTITTQVVFNPYTEGTFTATGPVCATGVLEFISEKLTSGNAYNIVTLVRFHCDDNSGSFVLQYHPQVNGRPKEGFHLDGPWSVWGNGGTGAYVNLTGSGWFGVVLDFSADPVAGVEPFVGFMNP